MATEHSLKLLQRELESQVVTDPLTGIANRRGFDAVLTRMWNRVETSDMHLSVLAIDIDHFKRFNDEYGHALGDLCLTAVAECLNRTLTPLGCYVARNGGEEFAGLLPATTLPQALEIGETLRRSVAGIKLAYGKEPLSVTVSIGLASSEKSAVSNLKALMVIADKALYDAKSRGRNQVAWRESAELD
jgi:diguanylate cyclase (GGDEF)-like protein